MLLTPDQAKAFRQMILTCNDVCAYIHVDFGDCQAVYECDMGTLKITTLQGDVEDYTAGVSEENGPDESPISEDLFFAAYGLEPSDA